MHLSRDQLLDFVRPHLKQSRYEHTVRVTDTAVELAIQYGADVQKAETASILHDFAKHKSKEELKHWISNDERVPNDLLDYHHELWHGPAGALMLENELEIKDPEILSAIACHTSGKKNMSLLDKVVFLADYIEPGRNFEGVEEVRELAKSDLDNACLQSLVNTVHFLTNNKRTVYPDTINAYNALV
ncbi:bis(5'-nucleosyl)-tetraphosphatase (symmetrical) YqeK [Halobacillus sp. A5]|uniref:bis(5'-nucleosyl)-tetraphosphatase (symmetrical) YqeK n=1 Tax=Halobacillus sp. A5 TaxID=2880263 RepID=UPI0020A62515|nr:bis(5'-nucleosyl)-tetraphosphatase (symmetrical) YqeK [Halobacillus sp. A5]MCP3025611.1 bis(5'-nucleosyl)-tetraphosphatase (symmetrical) YqeK [Halobacillus sp. A5]